MGVALISQHIMNTYQEDQNKAVIATEGTPDGSNKIKCFSYKVSDRMHNGTFKRRLTF